ncbi:MAG: DUF3592 domain-containing protein [Magnetococcales bacterium]|nr:DUF3592 domain-containing protein [Magnetococcales bacterium]
MGRPLFHAVNTMILLLGLSCLVIGGYPFKKSQDSEAWTSAFGTITESSLIAGQTLSSFVTLTHHVNIGYQYYTPDYKKHIGSRVEFGIGSKVFFMESYAKRLVDRYPLGNEVRLYYNPSYPDEAVLERSPSMGSSLIWLMLGFIFTIASFLLRFSHPYNE